ncbi:MAG TPA: CocE/NonD family hydrolase [Acidimicrobiia bacterium]|nr:CocE/NonD family hydrolase [Acidimicrobiia bacterium]
MQLHARRAALAITLVIAAGLSACSSGSSKADKKATFIARGGVEQVSVTRAKPSSALTLVDHDNKTVGKGTSDKTGALLFRNVTPGSGYVVQQKTGSDTAASDAVTVLDPSKPPAVKTYSSQQLVPGLNYLHTRDGTTLAAMVRLPGDPDKGPYPTVIEYSGYAVADPDKPQPSTLIAGLLGYATVGVNVRGTGCSGGAFDLFDAPQQADGYDVVETVAAQPWVLNGKPGMVGISYPGISQLFVAKMQPPHLAAIAPLSVYDDIGATAYPGGIFNDGFALSWAKDRQHDAEAAPASGQEWAAKQINSGDKTCKANQALRGQARDLLGALKDNQYVTAESAALSPTNFVDKIKVPTFLAGSFEDEQTGPHFPDMLQNFTGTDQAHFTMQNGVHSDPLDPAIIMRWDEFLDLYVAHKVPSIPPAIRAGAPILYNTIMGVGGLTLPPDRFPPGTTYEQAKKTFDADPKVRVLFDNGAGPGAAPGAPVAGFEHSFDQWPPKETKATTWYFGSGGTLTADKPTATTGSDSYVSDATARPRKNFDAKNEDDVWKALPPYNWQPLVNGKAVSYISAPLTADTVMVGSGSVDLWLQSSKADTDLQVSLTEVRPDGQEMYVQDGWLRASRRKLDSKASSALLPVETHTKADAAPLPAGTFSLVRVPLYPFGHAFRAGSRIRISVEAPGGDRPQWTFDTIDAKQHPTNSIAFTSTHPSKVVLPVIPGITVPTPLPACPSLRAEPCRVYVAPTAG